MRKRTRLPATLLVSLLLTLAMTAAADTGTGVIDTDALRVRKGPSTDTAILGLLYRGADISVEGREDDWFKITYNGSPAYIYSEYVVFTPDEEEAEELPLDEEEDSVPLADALESIAQELAAQEEEAPQDGEAPAQPEQPCVQQQVVDTSCTYIGSRYVYGGASPSGFDCSGFTMYIYEKFGYSIPHGATAQLRYGETVEKENLKMGDLVFFRDPRVVSRGASHVGIYIGGGNFVHAGNRRTGVIVSSLDSYWGRYYTTARRLIPLA